MKLWQKDFSINKLVEQFTIGQDNVLDLQLAKYDVIGTMAHIKMLQKIDLLTVEDLEILTLELNNILSDIENGDFTIDESVEDIHSQVEFLLIDKLGEVGKKVHAGRSRNDQVLVDLRLYFRAELKEIVDLVAALFEGLQTQSEAYKDVLMPGYTHTQIAMVSSFGLWFGAFAESLADDLQQLLATYKTINQNPLGSGAGYGSSFPLDRTHTTETLEFDDLSYNVVYAQMGRGKTELSLAFSLAMLGNTLNKLAADVCLFNSQNFGFLKLPKEYTTGSSIMPHKKNPDVFELIRSKTNQLLTLPTNVAMMTSNLTSGYHRDFQLLKEAIFPGIQTVKQCLELTAFVIPKIEVTEGLLDDSKYKYLYSVEEVNKKVLAGTPFRTAYQEVGAAIENGSFDPETEINHTHEGSVGNLCNVEIKKKFDRILSNFTA
jgi:argininosuccinate lyase